jgi:general secretion pathway protein E/type IV pilus assembly protein PilB
MEISEDILRLITPEQAQFYGIIPIDNAEGVYCLLIDDENKTNVREELELILGVEIQLIKAGKSEISDLLNKFYRIDERLNISNDLKKLNNKGNYLEDLLNEAMHFKSSDIHIEVFELKCRIRIRIDGQLIERFQLSKSEYPSVINKIKIMSNLDISEKRLPQDGRIKFNDGINKFDIRVSVLPTMYGEKIVLRLLKNDLNDIDVTKLGFSEDELEVYLESIRKTQGLLLISGPTGSGKTTTLYGTLKQINSSSKNILTIEDPIEYTIEGVNQVQLKENIGLNFASALRTFLRQDPDIIMVGEIRDSETATMAIRAALTGHLVLSTIHTNSAWGTVTRLIDMGIPSYLLSNTLNTTVAQRLIRLLCANCKQKEEMDNKLFPLQFKTYRSLSYHYVAKGCVHCHFTGYKGRKAIYEVIPIDAYLSSCIRNNKEEISEYLKEKEIKTISEKAFDEIENGNTSIDEVYSLLMRF